jgi:hypothetical protein
MQNRGVNDDSGVIVDPGGTLPYRGITSAFAPPGRWGHVRLLGGPVSFAPRRDRRGHRVAVPLRVATRATAIGPSTALNGSDSDSYTREDPEIADA